MTGWRASVLTVAALVVFPHSLLPSRPPSAALTAPQTASHLEGEDALVRVYDFILEARFDQVDAELRRACGPAPPEACHVLDATALWWRMQLDPESRALDAQFEATADRAIRTTTAWTERSPDESEAWFYLGGAYASRVQWRVLRGEKLAAARDGKRIKDALEQALVLDPYLHDAHFGIGMYRYYADVAPAAVRFLRFLLLLPGGDREEGLEQMLRARNRGRLLQGEADYQLHLVYLWYEQQTERALQLLHGLQQHYPGNPLFLTRIAEIQEAYQHDITGSLGTWRTLLAMAHEQRVNEARLAEIRARLGIADRLEALNQTDHAIEQLQAIVALKPDAPHGSLALAYLRLGRALSRLGSRDAAAAAYTHAVEAIPRPDHLEIREMVDAARRDTADPRTAEAYRLSLEGWRRLEETDLPGASEALERSLTLNPRDPVAQYRYGRLMQARRNDARALTAFEHTIRGARDCPPPILAMAYLEAARLQERAGHHAQARDWYGVASTLFGAAHETRAAAARALDRLR